jgi:hypothetical protein
VQIKASIEVAELNATKKKDLIAVSKNNKNAAAVGIIGKIRNLIENFFLSEAPSDVSDTPSATFRTATGYSEGVDYSYLWSLEQYRDIAKKDKAESWDELEKSVIASVADDVIVGIRGNRADIVVVKKF